jgi:hypothetical protein
MTFPVTVNYRRSEARIYGKGEKYPYYRVTYYSNGKRHILSFSSCAEAKAAADKKVREINKGSHAASLSPRQSLDAIAAFDQLDELYRSTGKRIGVTRQGAMKLLQPLLDAGLVQRVGTRKTGRYILA